jgi:hypothetical protein
MDNEILYRVHRNPTQSIVLSHVDRPTFHNLLLFPEDPFCYNPPLTHKSSNKSVFPKLLANNLYVFFNSWVVLIFGEVHT